MWGVTDENTATPESLAVYDTQCILESYALDDDGVVTLPVDVAGIAKNLVARVVHGDVPAADVGRLAVMEDGSTVIAVRDEDSRARQRYAIAYQLGHVVAQDYDGERHDVADCARRARMGDPREQYADAFARMLLMPRVALVRLAAEPDATVISLAETFRVSEIAMDNRLRELGIPIEPVWDFACEDDTLLLDDLDAGLEVCALD